MAEFGVPRGTVKAATTFFVCLALVVGGVFCGVWMWHGADTRGLSLVIIIPVLIALLPLLVAAVSVLSIRIEDGRVEWLLLRSRILASRPVTELDRAWFSRGPLPVVLTFRDGSHMFLLAWSPILVAFPMAKELRRVSPQCRIDPEDIIER